jgi:transposase
VQKWSQRSSPKNKRTREFLISKQITVLEHPPYSSDLAPSEFFLFPKIKEILKGRHFAIDAISSEGHSKKISSKIVLKGGLGADIGA